MVIYDLRDRSHLQDFHRVSVNQLLSITIALLIFSRCGLFPTWVQFVPSFGSRQS